MKTLLLNLACMLATFSSLHSVGTAAETVFEGDWLTTNRELDGKMTCVVTDLGDEKWRGRFHGVWQGVAFDYTVAFAGPEEDLRGTAQIDGADYVWKGKIRRCEQPSFQGTFGGSRYEGSFALKEKRPSVIKR